MRIAKVSSTLSGTNELPTMPIPEDLKAHPISLADNARTVLQKRYLRRGKDGNPGETEHEMFWRVAYHVALAEAEFDEDVEKSARNYFYMLSNLQFFPNSPTFTGAGTPLGQLAACFTGAMRVTTSQGLKRIADLAVGDLVLTHKGHYRPIAQLFERSYQGNLLKIKTKQIGGILEVTSEHPILTSGGWVRAGELKVGDLVAIGVPQGVEFPVAFDLAALPYAAELELQVTAEAVRVRRPSTNALSVVQHRDEQVFSPIESIESEAFTGNVYNCEVEEDHSYVTEGVVVHNCFVLAIDDDMGRTESGIFQTLRDAALIQQTGGGNGFAFSRLRPKGAIVNSSRGEATGPVGFLRVYDQAFGEIAQGGCLTPDTLVFTDRGLLRLGEIVKHDSRGWREHELNVSTDAGTRASRQAYNNGVAPVLRVVTSEGLELTGTPNHKIKAIKKDGFKVAWYTFNELEAGDRILVQLRAHQGVEQQIYDADAGEYRAFDTELAFLLGRLVAGGEIDDQARNLLADNIEDGIDGVPQIVRRSQEIVVTAFLEGLYTAAGLRGPAVVFKSEALAREVATLLLGIGYPAFIEHTAGHIVVSLESRVMEAANLRGDFAGVGNYGDTPFGPANAPDYDGQFIWNVTVNTIEPAGEVLTLDIEVDENHTYLANGMVTHNSRRGANMAVLKVSHPDIREFITAKTNESHITNFNISVGITDEFMRAVEADSTFDLINPQDGSVWETVRARDLFDQIVKQAHHNGEPGVLFLDAANRANPVPHLYELESTNPCGEQFLGPFENCCLGSINLANISLKRGRPNWDELAELTATATRFLDDVVSANSYVPSVPQLAEAAHRIRRIGLGIMGLADLMYKLGVRYGSEEGQEFAGQIIEFVRYHVMKTSIELAKERGAFPAIKGSIYDPDDIKWQPPTPLFPYSRDWGRPSIDWSKIVKGIKKHGIRNGAQTTVAPTGTIATVSGCEGYGCEPVFALAYIRHVNDKGRDLRLQYTSPLFHEALHEAGLSEQQITKIVEQVNLSGSCQGIADLPEHIRHTFVVSADITVEEHIRMQAAMQCFVDNAISKTINCPETATVQDVANAYILGWKLGCKGLTVYVTGSRDKVVLETHATAQAKQEDKSEEKALTVTVESSVHSSSNGRHIERVEEMEQLPIFNEMKKPRPRRLEGRTYRVGTPLGGAYVTVNENGHGKGQPFELFIHTSKAGSETAAISEAIGRLSSLILRMASPISPRERVREIIRQLEGIGGEKSIGFGAQRVRSLPDGIAQVLQEYLEETSDVDEDDVHFERLDELESAPKPKQLVLKIGDLCPECGEASVVNEEGCRKCYNCGFSEC